MKMEENKIPRIISDLCCSTAQQDALRRIGEFIYCIAVE